MNTTADKDTAAAVDAVDPLALSLYANRFENVVRHMADTLFRASRSGIINTAHDFSCCLIAHDDELIAAANSLPIHVLSGPELLSRTMKELHPDLRNGDAFLNNSPYHGNTHAADHTLLVPVLDGGGELRFTVMVKAHQADCGNAKPTTFDAEAVDIYDEGALIFPCVQVQRDYADNDDIIRMCRTRIRIPDQWHGDYLALVGAARTGERRIRELADECGWDGLVAYGQAWRDYSERKAIAAIGRLPGGATTATTRHDPFPGIPDGVEITVHVEIHPEDGFIDVDLTDNPDNLSCGLNLSESSAKTAAMIGIFNTLDGTVPLNGGAFRRLRVTMRENCCIGIPRHPASCSLTGTNLATRTANVVGRALAEVADGHGIAEAGLILPPSASVITGNDPRRGGAPFMNMLILAGSGGAGTATADAWLTTGDACTAGMLWRDSVEIDEWQYPIVVLTQRIIADTEGAGKRRGTPGTLVEFGPVDCDLHAHYASDGYDSAPLGVRGGLPGATADQWLIERDGTRRPLPSHGRIPVADGEVVVSVCTGGGGFGPPTDRELDRVGRDVREGWVSVERARDIYGVVVDARGVVDVEESMQLRKSVAATTQ
jgi:N-methylhydantoinase B